MSLNEALRILPSVDKVLTHPIIHEMSDKYSRDDIVNGIRYSLDVERDKILAGTEPGSADELIIRVLLRTGEYLKEKNMPSLRKVINATGIMIHTNLGRAVMPEKAVEMAVQAARGYTNLEFDLEKGTRGHRSVHLKRHLIELTGAEDALAVNNNAAAVLLMLDTFAQGKEVIVSRGELIEIGGSFRLPDILKKSGAKLVEVGCTNKTYLSDYENAITENTAMLLKSHKSNYEIRGFTHETPGNEIAELAKKYGLISAEDMGSGLIVDLSRYGLTGEVTIRDLVTNGLDLITFSGDKMLGGPQCGIIVGRKDLIAKMEKNPLTRALRLDKMTIAAMEGTLLLHRNPAHLTSDLPFMKMLSQSYEDIMKRCGRFITILGEKVKKEGEFKIIPGDSKIGGGAFPDAGIPTCLIQIEHKKLSPDSIFGKLLSGNPPVVTRIHQDNIVIDLRTVLPEEEDDLLYRLAEIFDSIK